MVNNGMQIARQIDIDLGNEVTKPRGLQPLRCLPFICKQYINMASIQVVIQ